jgi:hypothetical protein
MFLFYFILDYMNQLKKIKMLVNYFCCLAKVLKIALKLHDQVKWCRKMVEGSVHGARRQEAARLSCGVWWPGAGRR